MALPKMNHTPMYELTIPSSGKKVKYRPYLVREEKVLMIALETNDHKASLNAIVDTIAACVSGEFNTKALTTFDVEYMFIQIRSKSSGETSKIHVECSNCNHKHDIVVDFNTIKIEVPKGKNIHNLTADVSMELGYPKYEDIVEFEGMVDSNKASNVFAIATKCIKSISDGDERTMAEDCTDEELVEFLESLTKDQFAHISDFMESMPKLSHKIDFKCESCETENKQVITGMQSFL